MVPALSEPAGLSVDEVEEGVEDVVPLEVEPEGLEDVVPDGLVGSDGLEGVVPDGLEVVPEGLGAEGELGVVEPPVLGSIGAPVGAPVPGALGFP